MAVEGYTSGIVVHRLGGERRTRDPLAFLPAFNDAFDGFDTATDRGLDELCLEFRLVAKTGVECVPDLSLVGLALCV